MVFQKLIVLVFCVNAVRALPPIHGSGTDSQLYDAAGRMRVFHGVAAVNKGPPWYPEWLLNDTIVDALADWGLNVVRLGWMVRWQCRHNLNPCSGVASIPLRAYSMKPMSTSPNTLSTVLQPKVLICQVQITQHSLRDIHIS